MQALYFFVGKKALNKLKADGKMTSAIAKVAGNIYLCSRNRHITLFEQMDTTKAHKTSCQKWRLVFIETSGERHLQEVKKPGII